MPRNRGWCIQLTGTKAIFGTARGMFRVARLMETKLSGGGREFLPFDDRK